MGELGCNWEGPLHPPGLQDEVKAREGSEYQRGAGIEGHGGRALAMVSCVVC